MRLTTLLQIAAVLHIGLVWAGATMPRTVGLAAHLKNLPPFIRNLVWVYYAFVGLTLVSFAVLTFLFAPQIAAGEPVARALSIVMALLWTVRIVVAFLVFDARPYLTHWFYKAGYQITNLTFIYLAIVYAVAAWKGGAL
ncbi:MAG TPA: hypothetical protein VEH04_10875 [Verrucomicrobiae bacterium]|nr:hypothetical protein [Verrucomicrobiae bacterium]